MIQRILLSTLVACALVAVNPAQAITIGFTDNEPEDGDYADGQLAGQPASPTGTNWSRIYGPSGTFNLNVTDATGSGGITGTGNSGGTGRNFSNTELGGPGYVFDNTSSVLIFTADFFYSGNIATAGTFSPVMGFRFGNAGSTALFEVTLRPDGLIETEDDSGTTRSIVGFYDVGNTYSFTVEIDFANDTYSVTSDGASGTFTDSGSFRSGATQGRWIRLDGGIFNASSAAGNTTLTVDSITYTVPEPGSLLLMGLGGWLLVLRRCR